MASSLPADPRWEEANRSLLVMCETAPLARHCQHELGRQGFTVHGFQDLHAAVQALVDKGPGTIWVLEAASRDRLALCLPALAERFGGAAVYVAAPTDYHELFPVKGRIRYLNAADLAPEALGHGPRGDAATTVITLPKDYRAAKAAFEVQFIVQILRDHRGNVSRAAQAIGMARRNLQVKIRKLGLEHEARHCEGRALDA